MKFTQWILGISLLASAHSLVLQTATLECRCRPTDSCWPSPAEWNALNVSVGGNLVATKPVAHVCHDPDYDAEACNTSMAMSESSVWRHQQPGAVQWTNWEAWPERDQSCFFNPKNLTAACGQGRVPLFSVVAETAQHIQEAVRFAATHDIRLAIKNTGHCFSGRSSAPESLRIATNKMKSMDFIDDFIPHGSNGESEGSAVRLGAGVVLQDVYIETSKRNLSAVVGFAHTVGAAGGYLQGGGHSPLGPWKGMASDNALEFEVVTADGSLVVANEYQNKDLFWALRGGGGGTFGVVVSVTIRTFPDVPFFFFHTGFDLPGPAEDTYWETVEAFQMRLPAFSDAGASGYYFVAPKVVENGTTFARFNITMFFINKTNRAPIETIVQDFIYEARKAVPNVNYTLALQPAVSSAIASILSLTPYDHAGEISTVGSRMVSRDLLSQKDGAKRLGKALRDIHDITDKTVFTGVFVAGGAVADNGNTIDSALNPAWRRALVHMAFIRDWASNATYTEQKAVQEKLTNVEIPILKALEPDMGAYLNEADPYEHDFQASFWGSHYEKLYRIKQQIDPKGLFIARRSVGSEDWDDDGLCKRVRVASKPNII